MITAALVGAVFWFWLFGSPRTWAAIYGMDTHGFMRFALGVCEWREDLNREEEERCYQRYLNEHYRYRLGP